MVIAVLGGGASGLMAAIAASKHPGCEVHILERQNRVGRKLLATEIPEARAGDTAVLLGASGQEVISACDVARQAGTIANEILSRLGPRLERQTVCEPVPQRAYVHS